MNPATLSQNEVDSLLHGIADAASGAASNAERSADAAVRVCDLSSQSRIVSARMPGLESIHRRFVSELQDGLREYSHKEAEVTGGAVEVQTYAEFLEAIGTPTNANVVAIDPLRGSGLVVCEPALVCGLVDALFGGSGRYPASVEGRSFSATELRIVARLVEIVGTAYGKAWADVHPLDLVYQRSEMLPQFANVARASETVVASRFAITCGSAAGALHLCLPYAALDPVRDALYTAARGSAAQPEPVWSERLTQEIQYAEVDLVAELAQTSATVAQLLSLKAGDFMEVEIGPSICAVVDGVPIFQCHYGTSNGKNAIKIDRPVTHPAAAWPGAPHV